MAIPKAVQPLRIYGHPPIFDELASQRENSRDGQSLTRGFGNIGLDLVAKASRKFVLFRSNGLRELFFERLANLEVDAERFS